MNRYLYHAYADAREQQIRREVAQRRVPDSWEPRPSDGLADRLGRTLVHLGSRLITDRRIASSIKADLGVHQAA